MTKFATMLSLWALAMTGCAHAPQPGSQVGALTLALQSHPVVLLGEVHDNVEQHALRAQALRGLLESGARPALLMEQFDRERQPDIDAVLAHPGSTVDELLAAAAPDAAARQGWDWALYRPYVALALAYRLPLVAANVSRADARRVFSDGLTALGFDGAVPEDIAAAQATSITEGHCGMLDERQARRMVAAQVARDQFMARAIESHLDRGVVLLAGNGHVRSDVGVVRWLSPRGRAGSVSIGLLEAGDPQGRAFDRVFFTGVQTRTDPCEGLRPRLSASQGPLGAGSP